jgi:hypothetical protein
MRCTARLRVASVLEEKLALQPGSLEHGLLIEAQGKAEPEPAAAATLLLHAAGVLQSHDRALAARARHEAARALLLAGRTREAVAELRSNLRRAPEATAEAALARVSVGLAEVVDGNVETGVQQLQQSMHELHGLLGRAHPTSHHVQRLWCVAEITDKSALIGHL